MKKLLFLLACATVFFVGCQKAPETTMAEESTEMTDEVLVSTTTTPGM